MKRRDFIFNTFSLFVASSVIPASLKGKNFFQQGKKDTIITLIVDTEKINQSNKDAMTQFVDNRGGSSSSGNHDNFISLIDLDKRVIWDGQAQANNGDQVNVTMFEKKQVTGNKSLLKKDKYEGETQVVAKVRKNYEEGDESYNIYFTVIRNGVSTNYMIDPKLKIKT